MNTIVIVDDEVDIAEALASVLEEEGYAVVQCNDGYGGHRTITETRPDLVLMDVMMPGLNGLEVVGAMREDPALRDIPVILMSAVDPKVSGEEGGFQVFLRKPFTLEVLLESVRRQLAQPRGSVSSS